MQFKFFKADHMTTIEEAKKQYYRLCMRWHPDRPNGDLEAMQTINAEWDFLRKHNYNIHKSKDGAVYTDWNQDVPDDVTNEFAEIIEKLIHMNGLEVEVCGSWLWVGGNTKDHKDELKSMGMRWAPKKRMWYKSPKGWRRKVRRQLSMEEIRDRYGSHSFETVGRKAIAS